MNHKVKFALGAAALLLAAQAMAQITFYEGEHFRGRAFTTDREVRNFERFGFNDRASSVIVERGRWEVCEDARFGGQCAVLRSGSYDSLRGMGMNNRISSARQINGRGQVRNEAPEPILAAPYEYRRRPSERIFEAPVSSVRAVAGAPEQRCWMEQQQVNEPRRDLNVPGAVVGGVLGGVLGHQIGSGSGQTVMTIGGAVAGSAIGANVGRGGGTTTREVQRCETAQSGKIEYYDVGYNFRGVDHRLQMSAPPGRTIAVNDRGEPRQ